MAKVWVKDDWYIPVNDEGYVEGPCFEGMLGCVLQLISGAEDAILAMKIPRLLADTIEENAYICKMTEDEETAVRLINTSGGNVEGLMAAQFVAANLLIRLRTTINSPYPEARDQHDHAIFVSFERERKPRFCSVKFAEKSLSIFPEGCRTDFEANVSKDDWDYFVGLASGKQHLMFSSTVFRSHVSKKIAERGKLIDALSGRQEKIWYAAIPSMIFQWAGGNLQETITRGQIGNWSFDKHFILFEQVLKGVRFLHNRQMIHGDIRPANVMWISSPDPGNYRLGDYGSYGKEWQAVSRSEAPGGHTRIGPAVGQRRQSPFYSPERRAGNEFESADTAIITRVTLDEKTRMYDYVILLGWRSALIDNGSVKADVAKDMKTWGANAVREQQGNTTLDNLQRGDRLRLRNYLFEVIYSEQISDSERRDDTRKLFLCSGRYAGILHDSLVVYKNNGVINDWTVIDLSNYVEFHQWSAASDLYSVGALFLYSLFCCGLQRRPAKNQTTDPDQLFVEMIEILESVPYFRFFWEELETFRQRIEELYKREPQPSPEEVAYEIVFKDQTLFDMALFATNNILQSTPQAHVVLEAFEFNIAHFLIFMHFVLACLHRKSHMSPEASREVTPQSDFMAPFADSRIEAPMPGGAASRALERLLIIERYLDKEFFREFRCKDKAKMDKILDFDPRSDFQIRIEHEKLRMESLSLWDLYLHPSLRRLVRGADKQE